MVAHAIALDGRALHDLTQRRSDLLFTLRMMFADPDLRPDRGVVAEEFARLQIAERRLTAVAGSVVDALSRTSPRSPAPTYGRNGRMER
jgi:hypothetical protein